MEGAGQQTAGGAVLQPVEQVAQDAKARRHHAAGVARMHAFLQHLHLQRTADQPAQRGGQPELLVVAGARVQADHQAHRAEPLAQRVDVEGQVVGAAFLAGLDQADDARVRHALVLQRLDRGDRGIDRVAVVGAAAAVEALVDALRRPGAEVGAPAGELGLLVEVAVHQHAGLLRGADRHLMAGRGDLEEQHRRAAPAGGVVQLHDLQRQAGHAPRIHPVGGAAHHGVEVPVRGPVGVEHRALGRNRDVVGQLADDVAVPGGGDMLRQRGRVGTDQGVGGIHADLVSGRRRPSGGQCSQLSPARRQAAPAALPDPR